MQLYDNNGQDQRARQQGADLLGPVDIHGRVQSSPVLVIIDEQNAIMENEVMGAVTDMLNSSMNSS